MQDSMIGQNIIIKEPSKTLRALGRNALEGKWKTAIITVIVYLLLTEVPPIIFNAIFGTNIFSPFSQGGNTYGMDADTYAQLYNSMPEYCLLGSIYIILVSGALELGMTLYFLAVFRKHDVGVSDVFLGFEKFGKALGLYLYQALFITLWTFLFIIPGIIAAIRYSQAFFILADDTSKGIRQCMDESKMMMKGNKAKFFCLSLSFIGWMILCAIPSGILDSIGGIISSNGIVTSLFSVIGGLCLTPVIAYMLSTFAGFYEILAGHLIKETKPVPVTVEEAQNLHAELLAEQAAEEEAKAAEEETKTSEEEKAAEEEKAEETVEEEVNEETEAEEKSEDAVEKSAEEPAEEPTEEPADEPADESADESNTLLEAFKETEAKADEPKEEKAEDSNDKPEQE